MTGALLLIPTISARIAATGGSMTAFHAPLCRLWAIHLISGRGVRRNWRGQRKLESCRKPSCPRVSYQIRTMIMAPCKNMIRMRALHELRNVQNGQSRSRLSMSARIQHWMVKSCHRLRLRTPRHSHALPLRETRTRRVDVAVSLGDHGGCAPRIDPRATFPEEPQLSRLQVVHRI